MLTDWHRGDGWDPSTPAACAQEDVLFLAPDE